MEPKKMGRVLAILAGVSLTVLFVAPILGSSRHNDPKADSHRGHATTSSSAIPPVR